MRMYFLHALCGNKLDAPSFCVILHRIVAPVLALSLSLATTPGFSQDQKSGLYGRPIVALEYIPAVQPLSAQDLEESQQLKLGAALRRSDVAETIDRLFATGRYDDIQVDVEPQSSGVVVRFLTKNAWFVGHLEITGKISNPPNRGQIRSVTPLSLGTPFDEEALKTAEENIRQLFRNNGLHEVAVRFEKSEDPSTQQVNVTLAVKPGKRAKYDMPIIRGETKLSNATIIRATGWKVRFIGRWRQVTHSLTLKGADGIRKKYQSQDRLMAAVNLESEGYDQARRRVKPTLDINAGPKVKVRAVEAKVPKRKLKRYVPVYQEGAVDRDLLVEGARNLRDYFQFRGYPDVEVNFRQLPVQNDQQVIEYYISQGQRRKLAHIEITGNRYFTTETIRERMFLQPSSLQFRQGRYSEGFRKKDEETITTLYKSNGFRDAKVTSSVQTDYKGKSNQMAVTFTIGEGPQWLVASLQTSGMQQLDASGVLAKLSSVQGQPFSEESIASDRNLILTFYYTHGFPNASLEWSTTPADEPHRVHLHYKIVEGPRQFVRDVLVSGLRTSRPKLVHKNLTIKGGDPLSPVDIGVSQRKLYDLGVFARIDAAIQNPEGNAQHKYVIYDLEEANRYHLNLGVGAEIARIGGTASDLNAPAGATGFSPRFALDLSRLNFLGLGQTLALRSRLSNLQQRASLNYLAPRIGGVTGRDLTITGLYDLSRDVRTFASRRQEASVQLSQKLSKPTNVYFRFAYRRVSTSDMVIPALLVPQLLQPVRIGILSANLVQDRRDNPADAHRGIWNTIDMGVASGAFGSRRNFTRALARNATYHRIGGKLIFARETTFGSIVPFSTPSGLTPETAIPLPERFFGGGSISHRGFPENQAGPRDIGTPAGPGAVATQPTGFPLGGNALLFNNLELRFPLIGDNIGGVLFHDAGNIYSSTRKISFRVRQNNLQDFNYMVHAVGFGVRYKTPIGPLRGDLAYSVNPPRFVGFKGTIQELLACTPGVAVEQLPPACRGVQQGISHFQFFFSIGQTF